MFERILFPLDFSDQSLRMIDCVRELKGFGLKEAVLCHVAPGGAPLTAEQRASLERSKDNIRNEGIEVKEVIKKGDPVQEVLDAAEEEDVSLIAMASSGKGRTQEFIIGSTSFGIIRSSSRPVLVNKFPSPGTGKEGLCFPPIFQKALVPIDFSSCTEMSMVLLPELFNHGLREAVLFHVADSRGATMPEGRRFRKVMDKVQLDLDELRGKLEARGCRVSTHVHFGTVSYNILEASRELDASVIILGAHRKSLLREITLGGNSEAVVRRSTIPLLVIPCE